MGPKNTYCSSFDFSGLTGTIYGCADSENVGLMNSWWKMSRNDEDCWDSWHSSDSPHIVNILTVLSSASATQEQKRRRKFQSQETQHTNEQICLSSRITEVIASPRLLSTR